MELKNSTKKHHRTKCLPLAMGNRHMTLIASKRKPIWLEQLLHSKENM
jgi:hypothetical protein